MKIILVIAFSLLAVSAQAQQVAFSLTTELPGLNPQYGLNGEYLDMEEICVKMKLELNGALSFETAINYVVERILPNGSIYEVGGGIFAEKFQASDAFRAICLTESGYYRLTLYQQYADATRTNDYTRFTISTKEFTLNIKGKPQEKVLTRASGSSYYEIATLYLYEIKDGTPKDSYDWTFRLKDGVAMINFVVRMNDPLKLSEIKAVITRYDSKVSSKGVSVENEREYKRISFTVPSRDWNAVSANFSIEDKDHYIMDLFTQDDQFIERVAFIVK